MQILGVLVRRIGQIVATVVMVALLVFGLMRLLPGDPALTLLGERATDAQIVQLHHDLGLDRSIAVQFWEFLVNSVTLHFGDSITLRVPVASLIRNGLPITLMLTTMAALLALLIAVPLAFLSALRPGSWMDGAIRVMSQVSLSMPVFYIGLVLLIFLAAGLHWFPVGGIGNGFLGQDLYYLFLPALTLALSPVRHPVAQSAAIADRGAAGRVYVGFATAKGLSRRVILGRHVLRNAWISTITLLGLQYRRRWSVARSSPRRCSPFPASGA